MLLIEKTEEQYRKNNIFLEQTKSAKTDNEAIFKSGYIKCGAPFFKDALGQPAPFNEDYKHRKNVLKEFFPFDMPPTSKRWRTREKVALVSGVKQQMVEYIKSQQSRKLCEARKTRNTLQKMKFISHNQDLNESTIAEIYQTIQSDYTEFAVNWNLISFNDLHSHHSVPECMGMWYSYLRPDLNREPFSQEESERLESILAQDTFSSWDEIASELDQRSMLQTYVHYQTNFSRLCPSNVRWTLKEDDLLLSAINKYSVNGTVNWGKIGQIIPQRNKTQCYNRYQIIVKCPTTKKGIFSAQEDRAILEFVEQFGENAFKTIPNGFLPGRSSIQIKNHYRIALKHNGTIHPWTKDEDVQLMNFVEENGTEDWSSFAQFIQTHNRLSCRTRYLTITKFLKKNPGSTVADVPTKLKKVTAVTKASEVSNFDRDEIDSREAITRFKMQHFDAYNMLRPTFNFDFNAREINADQSKLLTLMQLLRVEKYDMPDRVSYRFTKSQWNIFKEVMESKLKPEISDEIDFVTKHAQFLMPPNYNTIVGLRYIAIKKHEDQLRGIIGPVVTPTTKYEDALLNFQKIYFSLFYWSAMLSKIKATELNELHFLKTRSKGEASASELMRQFDRRQQSASKSTLKRKSFVDNEHIRAKKAK